MINHAFLVWHLKLLCCNLSSLTIKVDLLRHSIWNYLTRTCKEGLRLVAVARLHVVEVVSLWSLHNFICGFIRFNFRVWDVLSIFTFIFHRIVALNIMVTRDEYLLCLILTPFDSMMWWVERHFVIEVSCGSFYYQPTFWTLIVSIEIDGVGLWN